MSVVLLGLLGALLFVLALTAGSLVAALVAEPLARGLNWIGRRAGWE